MEKPLILSSAKALNDLITPDDPEAEPRFLSRGILLIFGGDGSGKTSIGLDAAINAILKGLKVLYIDHELGVDLWRIRQIMKHRGLKLPIVAQKEGDYECFLIGNLLKIIRIPTLADLVKYIMKIETTKPDVLIVDSIVAHYLVLISQDKEISKEAAKKSAYGKPAKELIIFIGQILAYCGMWNMSVLLMSRPISAVKDESTRLSESGVKESEKDIYPYDKAGHTGGHGSRFDPKIKLELHKLAKSERMAVIDKHKLKERGLSCKFKISDNGVEDV
jgi:hypothetical protein